MSDANLHLEVDRSDHAVTRIRTEPLADLQAGQVRFRVDRFALTANNVTYAVIGDVVGYWDFFPTEVGWGQVPAMGWGEVVASAHPEVGVGTRHFGWFPMSRYVDLKASATAGGLRDEGAHRAAHAPVYTSFPATDRDPFYLPGEDAEDRSALLRGLYLTAFLADDFFGEESYYGASRALVISASSKTAIGFAQRVATRGLAEVVGLTSAGNVDFVQGLGCYDRVVPYEDIEELPVDREAVSIDMAGNGAVLERVHARLGDRLRYSMSIGLSHHDAPRPQNLPGLAPVLFFAPSQVTKRIQDWGAEGYEKRIGDALREFVETSRTWLEVTRSHGPDEAAAAWGAVLGGRVPPSIGQVVSLWEAGR